MSKVVYAILIFFVLTIHSCASSDDSSSSTSDNSSSSDGSSSTTELEGTWLTSCYLPTDTISFITTITVSGTDLIRKTEVHSDSSCNTDLATYEDTYSSLSIGDEVTFTSGSTGHKFSFNISSFKLTPQTTALVSALNAESSCGVSDWALYTATNYTGKTCGSTTYLAANTTYLGLYKLVGNNLFLGGFSSTGSYTKSVLNTITSVKQ